MAKMTFMYILISIHANQQFKMQRLKQIPLFQCHKEHNNEHDGDPQSITGCHLCVGSTPSSENAEGLS